MRLEPEQKFGRLTVVTEAGHDRYGYALCLCRCDCNGMLLTRRARLVSGSTQSCGCLRSFESSLRKLLTGYKFAAKRRGHVFTLTLDEFRSITSRPCYYCGDLPAKVVRSKFEEYYYNGIDRKNNKLGYTYENSVACCWPCNQLKSSRDSEEFLSHVLRIARTHLEN